VSSGTALFLSLIIYNPDSVAEASFSGSHFSVSAINNVAAKTCVPAKLQSYMFSP
jgi:hypothetical protein